MRFQSESRQTQGLAGRGPSEPDFSPSQGAPPWEGCQGLRTAVPPGAGDVAWSPSCRTGSAIASGSLPGSDPSVARSCCVRASLRCCAEVIEPEVIEPEVIEPEVIEPEVIEIGPGQANGPV